LRTLEPDNGWIHHLLQEAENERMHLFIFLTIRNHGAIFRMSIAVTQALFFNFYFFMYLISPKFSHRFIGYLEEEAVSTYTKCIEVLDEGKLPLWTDKRASQIAIDYYELNKDASFRDMILNIRADEAIHRSINHHFSDIP
jgi:hypothetical protein